MNKMADNIVGKSIHGHTVKKRIGSGGMANVYYAENKLGRPAAIKVLKSELIGHQPILDRFTQESQIMVGLNHPNIRKVYDIAEVNGQPAIIMEYMEGQTSR